MQNSEAGTFFATLRTLFNKGVRYSTVIDAGCADGHFFLLLHEMGIVPNAVPFNIDANRIYEDSLQAIKTVAGGDYSISALTDHEGEIELTTAVHPYWSSLRPENDPYWTKINNLSATKTVVPASSLDALCSEFMLKPPFLLKLDVQGAEEETLRGGAKMLKDTHVVVCEALMDDFRDINAILERYDFVLYDVTNLHYQADDTLGWFYPIYINSSLKSARPTRYWEAVDNAVAVKAQAQRRRSILEMSSAILARMQRENTAEQAPPGSRTSISRNDPCPCGSGKRYKHCCGAYG